MKLIKLPIIAIIALLTATSCSVVVDNYTEPDYNYITLEDVVASYDLWYVDYNSTTGQGDVPFLSKAFTISFLNGKLFANNNLVGIGNEGNGYGIQIGYYNTQNGDLEINHDIDGYFQFRVVQLNDNRIKLIDDFNQVTYFLEGYQRNNFDYDQIFYDNIEYFLQEYTAWEKSATSVDGTVNPFDNENYLAFTPENITTFYSSQDNIGTNVDDILWDYVGSYAVADVQDYDNLKILTLDYDNGDNEEFELSVIDDNTISLYQISTGTTYEFKGLGYIQYLKPNKKTGNVSNQGRKRTKVKREIKIRRHLK
ncbi:MAG: hypothetical protein ACWA42_03945 [Lutibacter sp.]